MATHSGILWFIVDKGWWYTVSKAFFGSKKVGGWINRWVNRWMNGWIDGWMGRKMDKHRNGGQGNDVSGT